MKLAIVGSREFDDFDYLKKKILKTVNITEVTEIVSGGAWGADELGKTFAALMHIPFKEFPADWDLYGNKAGYMRNALIVDYSDVVIAFWDGTSSGTRSTLNLAEVKGMPIYVFNGL